MKISFKTIFKIPYDARPMSPATEMVLFCVSIILIAVFCYVDCGR